MTCIKLCHRITLSVAGCPRRGKTAAQVTKKKKKKKKEKKQGLKETRTQRLDKKKKKKRRYKVSAMYLETDKEWMDGWLEAEGMR